MRKIVPGGITTCLIALCILLILQYRLFWLLPMLLLPYCLYLVCRSTIAKMFDGKVVIAFNIICKLLLIIVYSTLCKLYVFDIYRVTSGSMEATLKNGDVILINKLVYGPLELRNLQQVSWFRLFQTHLAGNKSEEATVPERKRGLAAIKRNDIFVYQLVPDFYVVKRCVGLPGEIITLRNDSILINSQVVDFPQRSMSRYRVKFLSGSNAAHIIDAIPREEVSVIKPDSNFMIANLSNEQYLTLRKETRVQVERLPDQLTEGAQAYFGTGTWTINNLGPFMIPRKGLAISPHSINLPIYEKTIRDRECGAARSGNAVGQSDYSFQENYYFMLGDNKPISEDSRYTGIIPERNIVGKVSLVLYNYVDGKFDWSRLLKRIW